MVKEILVISTRSRDQLYGALWHLPGDGSISRRLVEDDREALAACRAAPRDAIVVCDANLRRMGRAALRLQSVDNLVIFDHDLCQEHVRESDWFRLYIPVLKHINPLLVITSNHSLMTILNGIGINAEFLPKAFSPQVIRDTAAERDIPAAFVGRLNHKVYSARKKFVESLQRTRALITARADYGEEYNRLLHRINVFVSADIGFREHMIKNFEAMAAGCAVLATRNGDEHLLGFEDGGNILLYSSLEEADEKLGWALEHPGRAREIGEEGRRLAKERHTWFTRQQPLRHLIQEIARDPGRPSSAHLSVWERLKITLLLR